MKAVFHPINPLFNECSVTTAYMPLSSLISGFMGLPISQIVEGTGLSTETITQL
jgi:hypothetical protein